MTASWRALRASSGSRLRMSPTPSPSLRSACRELERSDRSRGPDLSGVDVDQLASDAVEIDGVQVLVAAVPVVDGKALLALADRLKGKLGDAAIVLAERGRGPRRPRRERRAGAGSARSARGGDRQGRGRRRSAAAAAAATRSRGPAGGTRSGYPRRSTRHAPRSRRRSRRTVKVRARACAGLRKRSLRVRSQRSDWRPCDPDRAGAPADVAARIWSPARACRRAGGRPRRRRSAAVAVRCR